MGLWSVGIYVPVAQMVEHMTFNHVVESSNLSRHTNHLFELDTRRIRLVTQSLM